MFGSPAFGRILKKTRCIMNNIWFTADTHFGHESIIKYCSRPFSSSEEMDSVMIDNWNSVVGEKDTVYFLGDFTLKNKVFADKTFSMLNGRIYVMRGSHDSWMDSKDIFPISLTDSCYLIPPLYSLETNEIPELTTPKGSLPIVLCHYSMRVWDRSHYGSFHLFGHSHGNLIGSPRSMDVGVDTHNFFPYHIDEVVSMLK